MEHAMRTYPRSGFVLCLLATACVGEKPTSGDSDTSSFDADDDMDGWTVGQGDCDDADPASHPDADEVSENGVDENCDASDLGVLAKATDADVTMSPDEERLNAGADVAGAGDLDGDGIEDILIGASNEAAVSNGPASLGRVWLVHGPPDVAGSLEEADGVLLTDEHEDAFGEAVSTAGDVDGDGLDDVLCGAFNLDAQTGEAYVFSGPLSGSMSLDDATTTIRGREALVGLGQRVAGGEDLNGDGLGDVVLSSAEFRGPAGSVSVFFAPLPADAPGESADATLWGENEGDRAGVALDSPGDVNGDGYGDLVAGAVLNSTNAPGAGAAYLVYGPFSGELALAEAGASFHGDEEGGEAGMSVAVADVDASGSVDLLVGAHMDSAPLELAGTAYGVLDPEMASYAASSADLQLEAETDYEWLGLSMTSLDLSCDGQSDWLVSASRNIYSGSGVYPGKVYVLPGPFGGGTTTLDASGLFVGAAPSDHFGSDLADAGDVNGDGCADLLVGAPWSDMAGRSSGAAYLWFGGE